MKTVFFIFSLLISASAQAEVTEAAEKADRMYSCRIGDTWSVLYVMGDKVMVRSKAGTEVFTKNSNTKNIGGVPFESLTGSKNNNLYWSSAKTASNYVVMNFSFSKGSDLDSSDDMNCARIETPDREEIYLHRAGIVSHPEYIRKKSEMIDPGEHVNLDADGNATVKKSHSPKRKAKKVVTKVPEKLKGMTEEEIAKRHIGGWSKKSEDSPDRMDSTFTTHENESPPWGAPAR